MRFLFLLTILLLLSCQQATYDVPDSVIERAQNVTEPVEDIAEEIPEPSEYETIDLREPLSVSVTAAETRAELLLNTTFTCDVSGGEEPYFYRWKVNDEIVNCEGERCNLQLEELGSYAVGCEVSDQADTEYDAALVEVIPEYVNIKEIYVLGDSLSAGTGTTHPEEDTWAHLLAASYDATLYNYAIPGATTGSVGDSQMQRFRGTMPDHELVFLWVGANDIIYFNDVGNFARAYEDIVMNLTRKSDDVILITIPDVSMLNVATQVEQGVNDLAKQYGFEIELPVKAIGREVLGTYNDVIYAIGSKYNLPVIDMFDHMKDLNQSYISQDQFHPNTQGHKELATRIQEDVESFYPRAELS